MGLGGQCVNGEGIFHLIIYENFSFHWVVNDLELIFLNQQKKKKKNHKNKKNK